MRTIQLSFLLLLTTLRVLAQSVPVIDLDVKSPKQGALFDWRGCEGKSGGSIADGVNTHPAIVKFSVVKVEPEVAKIGEAISLALRVENVGREKTAFLAIARTLDVIQENTGAQHYGWIALALELGSSKDPQILQIGENVWVEALESRPETFLAVPPGASREIKLSGTVHCVSKLGCKINANTMARLKFSWGQGLETFERYGCDYSTFARGDFKFDVQSAEIAVGPLN